ncbi:hypothetical protein GQ600_26599 [Phytophthora cactorum]|nr:hypothetical protein GQ600_26599 [Phytophthora cactorum]
MTPERRAKYTKTLLAAKPGPKAVSDVQKSSSNNLPPISHRTRSTFWWDRVDGRQICRMEDINVDEEVQRNDTDPSGPMSSHIEQSTQNIGVEDELVLLRAENALLKKKIKALEKGGRGLKLVVDEKEIQQIDNLLKKAEVKVALSRISFEKAD